MADAVAVRTILDNKTHIIVHMTNISDGTGEAAVKKVDKSAIGVAIDDAEAGSLDIESVRWNIQGMTTVRILWDHTTDDVALVLSGSGYDDFRCPGMVKGLEMTEGLKDPRSAGDTGDILLTTIGHVSGGSYDITLVLRKNPA